MKQLSKLALCACAALGIAACNNDLNDGTTPDVGRKTFHVTAQAVTDGDDSRALVNEQQNGFVWDFANGEQNILFAELTGNECYYGVTSPLMPGNGRLHEGVYNAQRTQQAGNTRAMFDGELAEDAATVERIYVAAYPKAALYRLGESTHADMVIPAVQKPSGLNNIDPAATVFFAVDENRENGGPIRREQAQMLNFTFKHVAAYARLRVCNLHLLNKGADLGSGHAVNTLQNDEVIDRIVLTVNDKNGYVAGLWQHNYASTNLNGQLSDVSDDRYPQSQRLTLDVKHLGLTAAQVSGSEGATFYFSSMPVNITDFTLTVYTTEGHQYTKHVTGANLRLTRANVTPFAVDFNEVEATPATYMKAYKRLYGGPAGGFDGNKDYIIAVNTLLDNYTMDNTAGNTKVVTRTESQFAVTDTHMLHVDANKAQKYAWNIVPANGGYYIRRGNYNWQFVGNNVTKTLEVHSNEADPTVWTFGFDGSTINFLISKDQSNYISSTESSWFVDYMTKINTSTSTDIYEDSGYYWYAAEAKEPVYYSFKRVQSMSERATTLPGLNGQKSRDIYFPDITENAYVLLAATGHDEQTYFMDNVEGKAVSFYEAGFEYYGSGIRALEENAIKYMFRKNNAYGSKRFYLTSYLRVSNSYLEIAYGGVIWVQQQPLQAFFFYDNPPLRDTWKMKSNSGAFLVFDGYSSYTGTGEESSGSDIYFFEKQ